MPASPASWLTQVRPPFDSSAIHRNRPASSRHVLAAADVLAGIDGQNGADSLTWLGHGSFLIRLDGRTVLTDPFLSSPTNKL